ncbi:MAG: potassium-transporting ATPase subunit KdpA [Archangium sp.]|nr:potassium-transporting ATPase subunit KdpA [Archangium sp.]
MTAHAWLEFGAWLALLLAVAWPLGELLARVLGESAPTRFERGLLRVAGVDANAPMDWATYAKAVLVFNVLGALVVFALQRLQASLWLNPAGLPAVPTDVAFNTAVSFATNTNWQAYGGESTMSHLVQMAALTTQNFVSAATGIAVFLALVRGLTRAQTDSLGNFWFDLTRSTLVLFAIAVPVTLLLMATGVPQTLLGVSDGASTGPVASQVAIKQLGTNGGGFFNVNSAHPLENPSPASNLLESLSILIIPAALCFTFGRLVKDRRQGLALIAAMLVIFIPFTLVGLWSEQAGVPQLSALGVDASAGHLEGKEVRFGTVSSVIWSTATTAASNGSVNAMHDSFTPLAGLGPMVLMQLGEIVFGGVGSGLYGMLLYVLVAVFISGLMVGRTPEYLGKKIEGREIKMAALGILLPSAAVLVGAAVATVVGAGAIANPGAHGFSEILYAFSSGSNNNGSAFGGLTVNGTFYAVAIGLCMWVGRFFVIIPVLAIAGSLASRKKVAISAGTLPTHTPLFVALVVATIVLVGALTFIPSLALGPIVEHLQMIGASS